MGFPIVIIQIEIDDESAVINLDMNITTEEISATPLEKEVEKQAPSSRSSSTCSTSKNFRGRRKCTPIQVETLRAIESEEEASIEMMPFYSGNPFVEKTNGILHIYKKNSDNSGSKGKSRTLCMLAVPAVMSSHDLLQFLAPFGPGITQIRIIRDNSPNQYMVLVSFCEQEQADTFYREFNGTHYNSLESDTCLLVFVAKIESKKLSEGAGLPIEGHTELPTCPVCLERMDESVDGILTVLCNHSFHANCLNQWGDTSCPVCRYIQTPELTADHKCSVCGKQEDLWICLICGNIGCGRYAEAHAVLHFQETQHTFSLEVGGQRVWDYAGDNYVHRLIQSKSDGKMIEFDNSQGNVTDEKLDGITLEYTYLLTNQLESQRLYFETKVAGVEKRANEEIEKWKRRTRDLEAELESIRREAKVKNQERTQLDKKLQQNQQKLAKCQHELGEERSINEAVRNDQQKWAERTQDLERRLDEFKKTKDTEILDLQEQLRDLMFHLEAEAKLKQQANKADEKSGSSTGSTVGQESSEYSLVSGEEIRESRLVVGEAAPQLNKKGRRKNR